MANESISLSHPPLPVGARRREVQVGDPKQREMELWGCPRALGKRVQGEHDGEKVLKRSLEPQECEHSPFSPHLCVGFGSLPRRPWWRCRWPPSEVQRGPGGGAWRLVGTSQRGS